MKKPTTPAPASTNPTVLSVSADLRLTTDTLARLSPEQVAAVFEGVGKITAATVADTRPEGQR